MLSFIMSPNAFSSAGASAGFAFVFAFVFALALSIWIYYLVGPAPRFLVVCLGFGHWLATHQSKTMLLVVALGAIAYKYARDKREAAYAAASPYERGWMLIEEKGCDVSACRRTLCQDGDRESPFWQFLELEDDGTWVMEWLHGPLLQGLAGHVVERDEEEESEPRQTRREQQVGRQSGMPVEERAHGDPRSGRGRGQPRPRGSGSSA